MKKLIVALLMAVTSTVAMAGKYPREAVRKMEVLGGFGSLVVVQPGLALSARHMNSPDMAVDGLAMTFIGAPKADPEQDVDVAAFRVPGLKCPCVEFAEYDAQIDEQVVLVGYPYGLTNTVTLGEVQMIGRVDKINSVRVVSTALSAAGSSGGGLFVRRNNRWQLVGILAEGGAPFSLAVPISVIRAWLEGRE